MAGIIIRPRSRLFHGHDWVYFSEVLKAFGTPEDAAELACFLGSDAAGWLTGQFVVLDGGISVNYL